MGRIDFVSSFYGRQHDRESLVGDLDSLLNSKDACAYAIPFSSDTHPRDLFTSLDDRRRQIRSENAGAGWELFHMDYRRVISGAPVTQDGRFFVYEHPEYRNIYVALTLEGGTFVRHGIAPILKRLYPRVVTPFIPHHRLRSMLFAYKETNELSEITITRASARLRFTEGGKHRRAVPIVSWPDMSLEEAFDWVDQNDGWFQSIQFVARDKSGRLGGAVSLTRHGVLRVDRLLSIAFERFVDPVCKTHYENIVLFSGRSRREQEKLLAKPLLIDFGVRQFADSSENAKLISAMRRLKKASVSVLHANPYVHMSVADYNDGSAFDLWVLSEEHLVVVPQMKGSIAAIKRVVNHIFDNYAEGEIRDYAEGVG